MGRLVAVLIIILVTLNYSLCDSSIEQIKVDDGNNNVPVNILKRNNKNSENNTLTLTKQLEDEQTATNDNSQVSLMRTSRTAMNKPLSRSHSKRKHGCSNGVKHGCKGKKFDLLIDFFKHSSYILKGFMDEIGNVLNWWGIAIGNLKNTLKQKKIEGISNGQIEMMAQGLPVIKNRIFELMGFFSEFFNFNKNTNYQDPSNKMNGGIKDSLENIKYLATLFTTLLKESHLMENNNSNNKLSKINDYFDSFPAEQCGILDQGLVSGYGDININGNFNKNPGHNNDIDILKDQTHMLQIMWDYINQLPAIFTLIFEIIGELFIGIDSTSTPSGSNNGQNNLPLPLPPWQSLLHCQTQSNQNQFPYLSGEFDVKNTFTGNIFPSNGHGSPSVPISEPYFIKKHFNDLNTPSSANYKGPHPAYNAQLGYGLTPANGNVLNRGYPQEKSRLPTLPDNHWLNVQIPMERSTVLQLLGATQLVVGDIIILNLTENIMLVGRVDNYVNHIIFNVIHRGVSLKSSYGQTHIWNLSYRDLSHNSRIYNGIMGYLGCH
ncbi:hypothetical protein PV326_013591 [Microctonus aethiopoides]|nr:hypothetical protein PV326_013591 [Microctonus aethiopoides]